MVQSQPWGSQISVKKKTFMVSHGTIENVFKELYIVCPGLTLNCIIDIPKVGIYNLTVFYN